MTTGKKHTEVVTATALAAHLFCSREAITRLEKQHVLQRLPDGGYDLDDCRRRVLEHLRERRPVVSTERQNFERARAQREQMKAEQMAGSLCKTSDFGEAIDDVFGFLIPRLDSLPSRMTRDLDLRKKWNEEIRQLRPEVAEYCRKRAAELGGGEAA
jgi:phage terminase Nu1 subunit (DNA packaging protein)